MTTPPYPSPTLPLTGTEILIGWQGGVTKDIPISDIFAQSGVAPAISVEAYGAVGNGVTDDSTAINLALTLSSAISFTPGKTYFIANPLVVPVTCRVIYGFGAIIKGPGTPNTNGAGTTVDGFTYTNWYIGGGTIVQASSMHYLPDVILCRRAVALTNSSWVNVQIQYILNCGSGIYCHAPGVGLAGYCVQSVITVQTIQQCNAAVDVGANILSGISLQGNIFNVMYSVGCNYGLLQTWGTTNPLFDQNTFNINIIDANGALGTPPFYAVYSDVGSGGTNFYNITSGIVPNANFAAQPFLNIGQVGTQNDRIQIGPFQGNEPTLFPVHNFNGGGPITTLAPGIGNQIMYVATTGSDTTGLGTAALPWATINHALAVVQDTYMLAGQNITIQLADGTYSAGLLYNSEYGNSFRGSLLLLGNATTPANVIINVAANFCIQAEGPGAFVTIDGMTLMGANGVVASNGSTLNIGGSVVFGAVTSDHIYAQDFGTVFIGSNYTVNGGAANHVHADQLGNVTYLGTLTVTLSGTLAFTNFAKSLRNSLIIAQNLTFTGGTITGARYSAALGGGIDTGGGGATYFPGNAGGTATSPGWYN